MLKQYLLRGSTGRECAGSSCAHICCSSEVFFKVGSDSTYFLHTFTVKFDESLKNDLISILILGVEFNINTKTFPVKTKPKYSVNTGRI